MTPGVTPELVAHLEHLYPDRAPDPGTSVEDIWIAVGAVSVVRKLRSVLNQQIEKELKTK